ncbi:helix-turn-helix domain containing protein [Streptomyces laculatispora]|uniref:Helix-turn-helix domain containing protein n=1 Tax=Streptomyces laculatispora TaxID=887464 RepID=A0ABY9IFB4_9ACTN|nr:TetR/AcrR family transcriptional regulator [Streptomyces laculatispora]WLQ45354.1 helix-turn-helix domain containing protein [Streptomyces laculatispora]
MSEAAPVDGFREPRQARSREKLQRVLQAAEDVLATAGFEDFTMAAVAARAGVSVGAIYRRFTGKEQLIAAVQDRILTQVEERLSARLSTADGCLAGVIEVYSHVLAEAMGDGGRFFPFLLHAGPQSEAEERGRRALAETRRLLLEAAEPHRAEILRSDPGMALDVIARTIVGACIHAVLRPDKLPDRPAWKQFADQLSDMAVAYLMTPDRWRGTRLPT